MLRDQRWVEVTPSAYEHEREGLRILRELLPDVPPFRVWTNFECKDSHGRTRSMPWSSAGAGCI